MKVQLSGLQISHVSSCLPKHVLDFETLKNKYGEKEVEKIIKTTGIHSVHIASEETTAADLCQVAAKKILNNLSNEMVVDGLIFVSQTRDHILPQTSHILQSRLGLNEHTFCLDIPLGCSGYIYGLLQASLLISSGAF